MRLCFQASRMCLRDSAGKSSSMSARPRPPIRFSSISRRRASSSLMRASSSVVVAMSFSPLVARGCREVDPERVPLELCAFGGRFHKGARQDEVASPRSDLQDELVSVPQELHLLLRRERQVEREHVAAVLATHAVRTPAVEELRGILVGEERRPELPQHLEPYDLVIEEGNGPHRDRRERLLDERL